MSVIYPLSTADREQIVEHLLQLTPPDRRFRFGAANSDQAIDDYVASIDFIRDAVFGIHGDHETLVGVMHVAQTDEFAELGLSVLESHRGHGLAQLMFRRAALHARNRGIGELYMHCLSENATMMHVARKAGMKIFLDGPERDAYLALPRATALSFGEEIRAGQLVLLDWTVRSAEREFRKASHAARAALAAG